MKLSIAAHGPEQRVAVPATPAKRSAEHLARQSDLVRLQITPIESSSGCRRVGRVFLREEVSSLHGPSRGRHNALNQIAQIVEEGLRYPCELCDGS